MTMSTPGARRAPFGHVFAVDGRDHYYDVHTNSLLAVEPALAAVLARHGALPRRELVADLAPRVGAASIAEACAAIARGRRERGLFHARRPAVVPPPAEWSRRGRCDRDLRHLVLTVTERCNLRCRYCVHGAELGWVRPHGAAAMSDDTAVRATRWFLDRADPPQAPVVSFYGGEALLEPSLLAAVATAARAHPRGAEVRLAVDTNGVLLDDRAVDLAARERMFLQVSLDGPASQHDRHRVDLSGLPTHAAIEAGLDRLLARDPGAARRLVFNVTLAPPADVAAVAAYFADFPPFRRRGIAGVPTLRVGLADLRGQERRFDAAAREDLRRGLADQERRYLAALAAGDRRAAGPFAAALCEPVLIRWRHRDRRPPGRSWTPGGNCRPGRRKLHVMPDGSLHPCERTGSLAPIGHIADGLDPAAVRGLHERFHAALEGNCRDCWAVRRCGACFATMAAAAGAGEAAPFAAECARHRAAQERSLALVARALALPARTRDWLDFTGMA